MKRLDPKEAFRQIPNTLAIENNDAYSKWLNNDTWTHINIMSKCNIEHFTSLFGKPWLRYKSEYDMHVWRVKENGIDMIIYSGKGKGSCYELVTDVEFNKFRKDTKTGENIINFMSKLEQKLLQLENTGKPTLKTQEETPAP